MKPHYSRSDTIRRRQYLIKTLYEIIMKNRRDAISDTETDSVSESGSDSAWDSQADMGARAVPPCPGISALVGPHYSWNTAYLSS